VRLRYFIALLLVISFGLCDLLLNMHARQATNVTVTRRGPIKTSLPDEVVPYLERHVTPGGKVLVYPYQTLYSFLSGTISPTKFEYLQAGMNPPAEFQEARRELDGDPSAPVLFEIGFRDLMVTVWPATPAEVVASDPLGDYILSHYRICKVLKGLRGPFAYMLRKDLPCPGV
jgi:hypothetical protein